jgi:hypothetical protein
MAQNRVRVHCLRPEHRGCNWGQEAAGSGSDPGPGKTAQGIPFDLFHHQLLQAVKQTTTTPSRHADDRQYRQLSPNVNTSLGATRRLPSSYCVRDMV